MSKPWVIHDDFFMFTFIEFHYFTRHIFIFCTCNFVMDDFIIYVCISMKNFVKFIIENIKSNFVFDICHCLFRHKFDFFYKLWRRLYYLSNI